MLTKQGLSMLDEARLRREVLIPLLRALGYRDVREHHGAGERGKDIVGWKEDDLGTRRNLALVVKATAINGRAAGARGSAGEARMQIEQCFGAGYLDPVSGADCDVHECWLVSSKKIGTEANASLRAALKAARLSPNVKFIDGDKLWEYVEKHLAVQPVWEKLLEAHEAFDGLDPHYRPEIRLGAAGVAVEVHERFPGAAAERPLGGTLRFAFPDTPEGRAAKEALERHMRTGAPAEIPGEFARATEFPALFRRLAGVDDLAPTSLRLGPAPDARPPLLVRIEADNEAGDAFALPYVELRVAQAGTEEITLANEGQPIPARVTVVLHPGRGRARLTVRFERPLNVDWYARELEYAACVAGPCAIRIVDLGSGLPLFTLRQEEGTGEPPDPHTRATIGDLIAIQRHTRRPLVFPDRDLTVEEVQIIGTLCAIRRTGEVTCTWEGLVVSVSRDGARTLLAGRTGDAPVALGLDGKEETELFGTALPLGPVRSLIPGARLVNAGEVRERLAGGTDEEIAFRFVPGDDNTWVKRYLDWTPDAASRATT